MTQVNKGMSYKTIRRKKRKSKLIISNDDDESEYHQLNNNSIMDDLHQQVTPNVCPPPHIEILNY